MGHSASSLQVKTANAVSADVAAKVRALVTKTKYESPKVISFPIQEMKTSYALSLAGNG